jgi:hypothetical protein
MKAIHREQKYKNNEYTMGETYHLMTSINGIVIFTENLFYPIPLTHRAWLMVGTGSHRAVVSLGAGISGATRRAVEALGTGVADRCPGVVHVGGGAARCRGGGSSGAVMADRADVSCGSVCLGEKRQDKSNIL